MAAATGSASSSQKHVMLSGRFNKPEIVKYIKLVKKDLDALGIKTFMVDCAPGDDFSIETMEGLYHAWAIVVFGTEEYGALTGAGYETFYELRHAHQKRLVIVPVQLCNVWPPRPTDHDGGSKGAAQNSFVLVDSLVRLVDKTMEKPQEIAAQIADRLLEAKEAGGHGMASIDQEPSAGYPKAKADPAKAKQWFELGIAGGGVHEGQHFTRAECYVKAIEADPKVRFAAGAWHNLGVEGGGIVFGETHSEKDCCLKALEFDPKYAYAWNSLGFVGGGTVAGKEYTLKECCLKALELDPKHAKAWNNLGNQGGGTVAGKLYSQNECYLKALEFDPKFAIAWHNLGTQGGGTVGGKLYSEKECFLKALEFDPKNARAWNSLGNRGGGTVAGKMYSKTECYLKALELDPKYSMAWTNFGDAGGGTVSGQAYTPKECHQKSLQLNPNNKWAQERLAKC